MRWPMSATGVAGQRAGPGARYGSGCPMRPRCRWRIDVGDGPTVVPYRLLVSMIENVRVDGKVRQQHIADLGAIDRHALPSLASRLAFWHELDARLVRLSNRIEADAITKVQESIHARIPRPTSDEIAAHEVEQWQKLHAGYQRLVDNRLESIADYEVIIAAARDDIARFEPAVAEIGENVQKVQQRVSDGDLGFVGESAEARVGATGALLRILAKDTRSA
jgi:hypothetical protein